MRVFVRGRALWEERERRTWRRMDGRKKEKVEVEVDLSERGAREGRRLTGEMGWKKKFSVLGFGQSDGLR